MVVPIHLWIWTGVSAVVPAIGRELYLFQELHVLAAHSSLAKLEQPMGGGRIMQDDLEDLGTEEVCQRVPSSVHCTGVFWHGEGRRRGVVVSRHVIAGEGSISRSDLFVGVTLVAAHEMIAVGCKSVAVEMSVGVAAAILRSHLKGHQRHDGRVRNEGWSMACAQRHDSEV